MYYARNEVGRLGERLKITHFDETANTLVAVYGDTASWDNSQQVGRSRLLDGHRYRVEVDPNQAADLPRYHHRLEIDLSAQE